MLGTIAQELEGKRKVILVHGNADMDAIGSAYAISRCFPEGVVFAPAGMDRIAKKATERLGISVMEDCCISEYDLVVAVDTSSPEQFSKELDLPEDTIVIDHHIPTGKWSGYRYYYDDSRTSCCEIVWDIICEGGVTDIPRDVGLALLAGMLTDSGHFAFANARMLPVFAEIMTRCGIEMDEAIAITENEVSMSEKIAMLKAVERSKFDRVGTLIVATAYGGSFEASSCKALMAAGADVAFVASQRENEYRVSARATQDAVRRGVNLGEILKSIGGETLSDGGGHPGAAGLSGKGDAEAMLHICMQKTMNVFRDIKTREASMNC